MGDNPEFDKELNKQYGVGFTKELDKSFQCPKCGADMIECYKCRETICKEGCEPDTSSNENKNECDFYRDGECSKRPPHQCHYSLNQEDCEENKKGGKNEKSKDL